MKPVTFPENPTKKLIHGTSNIPKKSTNTKLRCLLKYIINFSMETFAIKKKKKKVVLMKTCTTIIIYTSEFPTMVYVAGNRLRIWDISYDLFL